MPLLSIVVFLPVLAVVPLVLVPRALPGTQRGVALTGMLLAFAASLWLFFKFDGLVPDFQFVEDHAWIGSSIHYKVGVDGISILLVVLTTFLSPIALLGAWRGIQEKVGEFCVAMLLLETAMLGTLVALDLFLFYVFWELMLLPMYLIIGVWGGQRRIYATVKFVLYTMVGSVLMLVGIIYMFYRSGAATFDFDSLLKVLSAQGAASALSLKEQVLLFLAFGLAFAIKVPLFPFHTWLPDAHVEAPTPGSVILAGVLLKMGTYGFLRFAIPFFPEAAALASAPMLGLGVIGVIYGSLVAFAQDDIKKLVAYSSVAHLAFVMLGMFSMTPDGVQGSILQMVNHGLSTGALFLCVGFLYERRHTRLMSEFGGIARVVPFFAAAFLIVVLSSIGLPGTNGFVGEFLILAGLFREGIGSVVLPDTILSWRNLVLAAGLLSATGIVLGAVYMLTMFRKTMFGPITKDENRGLADLTLREKAVIIPVLALIFLIGLAPGLVLDKTRGTVDHYVKTYQTRVMTKRNEATAKRNDEYLRRMLQDRIQGAMEGAVDPGQLQWQMGPYKKKGGSDE